MEELPHGRGSNHTCKSIATVAAFSSQAHDMSHGYCLAAWIRSKSCSGHYVKCFLREVHISREQAMGFGDVPAQRALANHVCRYVGLQLNMWFTKIRTVPDATPPDILEFFDNIMMDENWEKPVPMAVLSQLGLQRFHSSQQVQVGGAGVPTGSTGRGGGSGQGSGGSSGGGAGSGNSGNTHWNTVCESK